MSDIDKPPIMLPVNLPFVRRVEAWLWNHPKMTILLMFVSFALIYSPAWFSDVWALFSNESAVPRITNFVLSLPISFSWYWIPMTLGAILFAVIAALFWREKKRLDAELASATAKIELPQTAVEIRPMTLEIQDSLHGCPGPWLHEIADSEVKRVWEFIEILKVGVWEKRGTAIPTLEWGFVVKNNSLFPISLDGDVRGHLSFEGTNLLEQKTLIKNQAEILGRSSEGTILFEQRLSKLEFDLIKDKPEGRFSFQGLQVFAKGAAGFEQIKPWQLRFPDSFRVSVNDTADETSLAIATAVASLQMKLDLYKTLQEGQIAPPGNLVISRALYGVPGIHEEDVTAILAKMVANNTLTLDGYYNDFLPDKVKGKVKQLLINYSHNGIPFLVTVPENTKISLPLTYRGPLRGPRPQ